MALIEGHGINVIAIRTVSSGPKCARQNYFSHLRSRLGSSMDVDSLDHEETNAPIVADSDFVDGDRRDNPPNVSRRGRRIEQLENVGHNTFYMICATTSVAGFAVLERPPGRCEDVVLSAIGIGVWEFLSASEVAEISDKHSNLNGFAGFFGDSFRRPSRRVFVGAVVYL